MEPEDGKLDYDKSAAWHNGSWRVDKESPWQYNQVYRDGPAPTKLTVKVSCKGFSQPYSQNFDLIRWGNPTGNGALLLPFVRHELADDEYVVTSAVHGYNGAISGTQIFAYDISIQARTNGDWNRNFIADPTKNKDSRIFGRSVRAMAPGEVIKIEDGFKPGEFHSVDEGFWDNEFGAGNRTDSHYGSNTVWVRYGDLEVGYHHLRRGSIVVEVGDVVSPGRKLAEAGNSGNTQGAPHLHMECRVAATNKLCGMTFRNTWQLERTLVPADNSPGKRVRIDDQGICQQAAALRPFATNFVPPRATLADPEVGAIFAEIFGGVANDGGGFFIINGKLHRVPPRGIKWQLLNAIAEIGEAEELGTGAAAKPLKAIFAGLEKSLKTASVGK
jgi:Peptidase family M23